ncbi:hypothetical protein BAUCODRAFT_518058 [Baudoinia panamericana UAMH 10762]|uniref:Uncharacterized protein n=1 Tax=Baudoinia panamericana (strain UAMH 10762) TaxID=717646 RepID=M2MHN7_BAUPA|nr:uncharacterized protein BAUCODRAFT_518058 [Baudoinia panamericana UAMH 10762]EMC96121.1 hypothetical protein BAUCODRAFT_518058 [Baudoinia panamericana UAMH 10762]
MCGLAWFPFLSLNAAAPTCSIQTQTSAKQTSIETTLTMADAKARIAKKEARLAELDKEIKDLNQETEALERVAAEGQSKVAAVLRAAEIDIESRVCTFRGPETRVMQAVKSGKLREALAWFETFIGPLKWLVEDEDAAAWMAAEERVTTAAVEYMSHEMKQRPQVPETVQMFYERLLQIKAVYGQSEGSNCEEDAESRHEGAEDDGSDEERSDGRSSGDHSFVRDEEGDLTSEDNGSDDFEPSGEGSDSDGSGNEDSSHDGPVDRDSDEEDSAEFTNGEGFEDYSGDSTGEMGDEELVEKGH